MSKITDSARGKACTIRTPWCIDGSPHETTVPCHAPSGFGRGMAHKAPDWAHARGCYVCHSVVDGRAHINETTADQRFQMWCRGFFETMQQLIAEGLVVIQ